MTGMYAGEAGNGYLALMGEDRYGRFSIAIARIYF